MLALPNLLNSRLGRLAAFFALSITEGIPSTYAARLVSQPAFFRQSRVRSRARRWLLEVILPTTTSAPTSTMETPPSIEARFARHLDVGNDLR